MGDQWEVRWRQQWCTPADRTSFAYATDLAPGGGEAIDALKRGLLELLITEIGRGDVQEEVCRVKKWGARVPCLLEILYGPACCARIDGAPLWTMIVKNTS